MASILVEEKCCFLAMRDQHFCHLSGPHSLATGVPATQSEAFVMLSRLADDVGPKSFVRTKQRLSADRTSLSHFRTCGTLAAGRQTLSVMESRFAIPDNRNHAQKTSR